MDRNEMRRVINIDNEMTQLEQFKKALTEEHIDFKIAQIKYSNKNAKQGLDGVSLNLVDPLREAILKYCDDRLAELEVELSKY